MGKSNSEIRRLVLQELKWDTRIDETDVGVEIAPGIVTLTGTVSSWTKKIAAQEAAHRVIGVLLDLANEIKVMFSCGVARTTPKSRRRFAHRER